jgi:hypothetical protein
VASFEKEIRPKDIQTIDELFKRNFTIYGYNLTLKMVKGTEFENRFVGKTEYQIILSLF